MRERWVQCPRTGDLVPAEEYYTPKAHVHAVHPDEMDALVHPITGKMMTSKRAFREVTRQNGCEEVGNDWNAHKENKPDVSGSKAQRVDDIKRAMYQLGYYKP